MDWKNRRGAACCAQHYAQYGYAQYGLPRPIRQETLGRCLLRPTRPFTPGRGAVCRAQYDRSPLVGALLAAPNTTVHPW
ncbi:hypothetical protein HYR99_16285 [Candidatus Poribacteria bacterium]|nr:hypothetical protein [Candidatus Poribacteria bacterium]